MARRLAILVTVGAYFGLGVIGPGLHALPGHGHVASGCNSPHDESAAVVAADHHSCTVCSLLEHFYGQAPTLPFESALTFGLAHSGSLDLVAYISLPRRDHQPHLPRAPPVVES
jgi:hypothetical protein